MEQKTQLTIGAIVTLALVMSGAYYVADTDQAYHCASRDIVMICEKLSSGIGSRCYYENTYKTCKEGWVKIDVGQEVQPKTQSEIPSSSSGTKWECSPDSCEAIN